jgi:hypothetical protein
MLQQMSQTLHMVTNCMLSVPLNTTFVGSVTQVYVISDYFNIHNIQIFHMQDEGTVMTVNVQYLRTQERRQGTKR